MTIGASIFLIAVGAILRFAVSATTTFVSLQTVGDILMVAGVAGLLIGLFLYANASRRRVSAGGAPVQETYVETTRR